MRNVRTWVFTHPNGTKSTRVSDDLGRAILSGGFDDRDQFDVPSLHGIGQTAPYVPNDSVATPEDVLDHDKAFFALVERSEEGVGSFPGHADDDARRWSVATTKAKEAEGVTPSTSSTSSLRGGRDSNPRPPA